MGDLRETKHGVGAGASAGADTEMPGLLSKVRDFVKDYMGQYDASHDWTHILRVENLAKKILAAELSENPQAPLDADAVVLAALLHDVGDSKYLNGQETEDQIATVLRSHGCPEPLALKVQTIAKNVSFSHEKKNPDAVRAALAQHPELGMVQDADRLDAIGAVGIARTFTFGGAKRPGQTLNGPIDHFVEKLELLENMMKTTEGKRLARERTERLVTFRKWWAEETDYHP